MFGTAQKDYRPHLRVLRHTRNQRVSASVGYPLGYGDCPVLNHYRCYRVCCDYCLPHYRAHKEYGKMVITERSG